MGFFENVAESYYDPDSSCKRTFWIVVGVIFGISLLVITFALIGVSVNKRIENNEYGVVYYKKTTMELGEILEQGIHSIAPGAQIIKFNRTLQDVDTDEITCFSKDKIKIVLSVSVQYQLIKEDIIPVILKEYDGNDNFKNILKFVVERIEGIN